MLLPDDLTLALENCRRYMNALYGCKSGHGTPVHVTLVPPFLLPSEYTTADLAHAIERTALPKSKRFTAHIDHFDAFGDRTLFARVLADDSWTTLRDATAKAVSAVCPGHIKKDRRPFQPHTTVANRDIPAGVMTAALQALNELNLTEDFPVDNITIFEYTGGRWEATTGFMMATT